VGGCISIPEAMTGAAAAATAGFICFVISIYLF
jgi:hypothetical protein